MSAPKQWRVVYLFGFTISHPYMAVAPTCDAKPHPTRFCGCQIFRKQADAARYIAAKQTDPTYPPDDAA